MKMLALFLILFVAMAAPFHLAATLSPSCAHAEGTYTYIAAEGQVDPSTGNPIQVVPEDFSPGDGYTGMVFRPNLPEGGWAAVSYVNGIIIDQMRAEVSGYVSMFCTLIISMF